MAAPSLTREQKQQLVERLRSLKDAHVTHLHSVSEKVALRCERKVVKRLKKVSMPVRSVAIHDVLNYEREKAPTIAEIGKFARP